MRPTKHLLVARSRNRTIGFALLCFLLAWAAWLKAGLAVAEGCFAVGFGYADGNCVAPKIEVTVAPGASDKLPPHQADPPYVTPKL